MTNEVATTNQTQIAMPADLAALFGGVKSNVVSIERVNTLRISGKVWKVDIDGEQKKLTTIVEGEEIPVPMVKVIILNQNPKRARALFEAVFEEGASVAPVCWSSDSVRPDSEVQHPKASSCEQCAESQKKTKFDDNNPDKIIEYVPCKFNKRIAVVQHNRPDSPALRLQLAVSSLWEPKETAKNKEIQGWYAYDNYLRFLATKGITNTAMCRTIMKFDPDSNGVKILFKFDGLIDTETAAKIVPRIESEEVQKCLGTKKHDTVHETPVSTEHEHTQESEQDVANIAAAIEAQKAAEAEAAKAKAAAEKKAKAAAEKKAKEEAEAAEKAKADSKVEVVEADSIEDALSVSWD